MVEVFKTNIKQLHDSIRIIEKLLEHYPNCKINFDLEDCDHILRVEGNHIDPTIVLAVLYNGGYNGEAL